MSIRKMLGGTLAALALAEAQAQAPAEGIQVRLSGQVNRALLHADDGANSEWFNVDNSNSSTRFRFNADGPVVPNWRAGILLEFEFDSNPSSEVNFVTRSVRSEEHTSELQSQSNLVCRLLLEKKKKTIE